MFKWILRELLAVLLAWLQEDGSLAGAIWAWFQVITGQVSAGDTITTPANETHLTQADLHKLAKTHDTPALRELIEL